MAVNLPLHGRLGCPTMVPSTDPRYDLRLHAAWYAASPPDRGRGA
jgi:hypothetical protein